jgi:hypothetical protein
VKIAQIKRTRARARGQEIYFPIFERRKRMKRDRFQRKVLDGFAEFGAWMRVVLRERRGETPYELLCEWRRAYSVPLSAPYVAGGGGARIEEVPTTDGTDAFCLIENDDVLAFARTDYDTRLPIVTLYHSTLGERDYTRWRSRARWSAREPRDFMTLPADVWMHFARHLRERGDAFHQLVSIAGMPLCRAWVNMWRSPRFEQHLWNDIGMAALPPQDRRNLHSLEWFWGSIKNNMRGAKKLGPKLIASLHRKVAGRPIFKSGINHSLGKFHTRIPRFYIEVTHGGHVVVRANGFNVLDTFDPCKVLDFMCSPLCIPLPR